MLRHWPSGNARNFMTTWSTNFLYHCSKDLNELVSPKELRTIQSAWFVLINGFSFPINSQLYQYIDKYGGASGLARAKSTYLCDVKAARPCMSVLNALFLKPMQQTDNDIKMRIQIEQIGQFMVGTPDYTAMGRSMQILRHTGSMICSGIRKPGKYICRFLLMDDDLHSDLLLYSDHTLRQNQSDRSYPRAPPGSFSSLKMITSNHPGIQIINQQKHWRHQW